MNINVNATSTAVNIQVCTSIEDTQEATQEDTHLQGLKSHIIHGWPHKKDELEHIIPHYWPLRCELAMIDDITMKDKRIIIPFLLQKQILQQLHSNCMSIEEMRLLAHESVYWININTDIKNTVN